MNAFQKRNFKLLVDPTEQGISCFEQYGSGQNGQYDKEPTSRKAEPSYSHPYTSELKTIFFVHSITNDDVLANNIHNTSSSARSIRYFLYSFCTRKVWQVERRLHAVSLQEAVYRPPTAVCWSRRATVNLINFPNSGQTDLVSFNELLKCCREFSFQYNILLYCRACVRSEAYTVLFARKGKSFFARHIADI